MKLNNGQQHVTLTNIRYILKKQYIKNAFQLKRTIFINKKYNKDKIIFIYIIYNNIIYLYTIC